MGRVSQAPRSRVVKIEDEDGSVTELRLCFDANAMLLLEKLLGLDGLTQIGEKFDSKKNPVSIGSVISLVYCATRRYQNQMKESDIGALIGPENMAEILEEAVSLMTGSSIDQIREQARDEEVRIAENPLPPQDSEESSYGPLPALISDSPSRSSESVPSQS